MAISLNSRTHLLTPGFCLFFLRQNLRSPRLALWSACEVERQVCAIVPTESRVRACWASPLPTELATEDLDSCLTHSEASAGLELAAILLLQPSND